MFAAIPMRSTTSPRYMAGCHARLGDMERAQACVAECLALRPDFSVRQFMSKEPFKLAADAERLAESLRLAGLPDDGRSRPGSADVLDFWFAELGARHWFARSAEVDARDPRALPRAARTARGERCSGHRRLATAALRP